MKTFVLWAALLAVAAPLCAQQVAISGLTEVDATPAATDFFPFLDASANGGAGGTRRVSYANVMSGNAAGLQANPTIPGKITWTGTAVNDDDCTGDQGKGWWDSTDTRFEWCDADSGTPLTFGDFLTAATAATTYQPLDADLTAVAAFASTGVLVRTGANTYAFRAITGDSEIVVTNGDGVAGAPTLAIAAGITRDAEAAAAYQPVDADLTAVAALSATGMVSRTGAATYAPRAITGNAQVSVTNGDGVAGAPTLGINADSIGPTQIDETATYDFSGGAVTLPSGTAFGSGSTPFNLTGYTDDVAPSAPGTANQFTFYVDRTAGRPAFILNSGAATLLLTTAQIDTIAELETILGSVNVLLETEIDASSELAALMDDETGSGALVFGTAPTITNPVLSTNTYQTFTEMAAPGSPAANDARLYAKDNGSGTTQICMKDSAGTETCIGSASTPACDFPYMPAIAGRSATAAFNTGKWGATAPSEVNWDQTTNLGFDTVNESVTWTFPVPRCYTGQTMDMRLYFLRYSVGTVDQQFTLSTAFRAHDEATANNPTYNTGQTFDVDDADVSASGDIIVKTISGLTMSGTSSAAANEMAYIKLELTTDTSGTGVLMGFQIVQQ